MLFSLQLFFKELKVRHAHSGTIQYQGDRLQVLRFSGSVLLVSIVPGTVLCVVDKTDKNVNYPVPGNEEVYLFVFIDQVSSIISGIIDLYYFKKCTISDRQFTFFSIMYY